jgi:hypothetical protein
MRKALFLVIGILFICSMFAYGQKDTIIKKTEVNKQELSNTNKTPFEKNAFESWNIILIVAVQTFAVIATFIGLRVGRKNIEKQIKSTEANLIKKNYLDSTMRLVDAIANIVNECSQAKDNTGITNKKPCSDIHLINEMKCIMLLNKTDTIENDFYNCITKYRNAGVSIIDDWIKEIEEESYHVINNRLNNN